MTYRGRVSDGVVVLEGKTDLADGTIVAVEPLPPQATRPRRGTPEAILEALHAGATWEGSAAKMDRFLEELHEEKLAEARHEDDDRQARDDSLPS